MKIISYLKKERNVIRYAEVSSKDVSSVTMILAVVLVVKASLLCVALVTILYRYITIVNGACVVCATPLAWNIP